MLTRERRFTLTVCLALAMSAGGCAAPAEPPGAGSEVPTNEARHLDAPYVVLVSFDGFAWDLMDRVSLPNFERVAAAGARAERMIPIFPTKTFPTHYSVATGMYAEHHGLVGNRFWAPDLGASYSLSDRDAVEDGRFYRGEPIWVTAVKQGMVAASFFFVGSEAPVGGVYPSYWHRFDGAIPRAERVDAVLGWLSMPAQNRPHMITLYFEDVDGVAHAAGMDSPEVAEAAARVDESLGLLLDGIEALPHGSDVYVVLVSDHGLMAAPASMVDLLDMDLFPGVRLAESGPYASLFIDDGGAARAPQVRDSIAALLPENEVWLREDVPERLHYSSDPRIGDIVVSAAPGRRVLPAGATPRDTYTHGWDNLVPEMHAIFLALGPGIAPGQEIPPLESVDVYPFLAHVLGLTPNPAIDGDIAVLRPILGN